MKQLLKKKRILGNVLLLITAIIWGTAFSFQRVGMDSIEPITFNAARMALAAVMIGALSLILWKRDVSASQKTFGETSGETAENQPQVQSSKTEGERRIVTRNTILGGLLCGTFLTLASISQQMGIVYTTAGKAGFITAMYMLLVPIISFLVFKKKNTLLVWLAVLLGVAGMYLLCITDSFSLTEGDSLVALCALFFSCHILCCDHFSKKGDPIRIAAIQFATSTVISTVVALIVEEPTVEKLMSAIVPIAYCGLVSGGIGYTLQVVAQRFTDPTIASLLMSMEAVFAVIAGALLLGERMTPREIAGCIVMFIAIILVQLPIRLPGKKNSE